MRKMKDSGITWIGDIPNTWKISRLKYYVFSINSGERMEGNYNDGDYPILGGGDVIGFCNVYNANEKAILIGRVGARCGCVTLPLQKVWATDNALILFVDDKICTQFAYYLLRSVDLNKLNEANAQPLITTTKIRNVNIPIPTLIEQNAIADYLNCKCAEIDTLTMDIEAQIKTLEQYKQSVITEAVTKGLNLDVEMKDSGVEWIGQMPSHWELIRGKFILTCLQRPVRQDDEVITCFRDGEVTLRSNRREEGFTMSDKEIGYQGVDVGDLVVHGMDGFAGAIGISDSKGKASPVLNVLDSNQNKRYIMYYLRSIAYSNVFLALATGIRVRSCDLRWNKLSELFYPVPPLDEQESIVNYIDEQIKKANILIADKQVQLDTLAEYKKSMIYEYVTGKKEVPSA